MYYTLKHRKPVPCDDVENWAYYWSCNHRRIRYTTINQSLRVSTVFLGVDHAFADEGPILFETAVLDKNCTDHYMRRCKTHREALAQHWEAVRWAKELDV